MVELLNLIGELRQRIAEHDKALRQNEALTRYALINPLLRALAWNTADPAQVIPEFRHQSSPASPADYALLRDGRPIVVIEAKKLGSSLAEAVNQVINYCVAEGYEYFAVTDGQIWHLYETHRKGDLKSKRVTSFDVVRDSPSDVCLKALALWRHSVADGVVRAAERPVSATPDVPSREAVGEEAASRSGAEQALASSIPSQTGGANEDSSWTRLDRLRPKAFAKPKELRLPSMEVVQASSWTALLVELTSYLVKEDRLSTASGPIQVGGRFILANAPVHPNGAPFRSQKQVGPVHLETSYSGRDIVKNAGKIVTHAGMGMDQFHVRMATKQ